VPLTGSVAVRSFLVRGLLAGLIAGLAAFAVAYVVGEPSLSAAISLEDGGAVPAHTHADEHAAQDGHEGQDGHSHGEEGTVVPRSLQSTLGLATGTVVAGVTLGGLLGVLAALALGRLGRTGPRATSLLLAAVGFVAVQLVPFAVYPPNPPGVGDGATIGLRTSLYFVLLAISVVAAVTALLVARSLRPRWGGWYAGLAGVAGYLVVVAVVVALLPGYDEVPDGYPASLLFDFRMASLLTQATLWAVLGVALAELTSRLVERPDGSGSRPRAPPGAKA
jgi:predicted cobalt transporter CbtA